MRYDEYTTLLLSAASTSDVQRKPKKVKRHVMFHDLHNKDHEDIRHTDEDTFDINCPINTIQAFATNFRPQHSPKNNSEKVLVRMKLADLFGTILTKKLNPSFLGSDDRRLRTQGDRHC